MNSIVRVRDDGGLYGEQWNLSGACRVSIVLGDLSPRPQAVLRLCDYLIEKNARKISTF
jgi:hypothetical protein